MRQLATRTKASREEVIAAIKSGQYTMIVGGHEVTDYNQIDQVFGSWPVKSPQKGLSQLQRLIEKFNSRCHFCRRKCDKDSPTNKPMRDWLVNSERNRNRFSNLVLSCFSCFTRRHPSISPAPRATMVIKINGTDYSAQRLEHFGDAIILLAARLLADELYGKQQRLYTAVTSQLVRNENLATYPAIRHPDQFEVIIGQEFTTDGIEPALDKAKEMLRETRVWKEASLQNPTTGAG